MINQRIIYPTSDGGISIIIPSPEWISIEGNTIETLAKKDVPNGLPYKIIDETDVPDDRTFRAAWTAEFNEEE